MTDTTLTLSRDFAASPAAVWRCMTDPDLIPQWFAPAPVTVSKVQIDPTPGGIFHVVMFIPEMGEMDGGAGCILQAIPQETLTWTTCLSPGFVPALPPAEGAFHFTARLTLEALGDGTRYTATLFHADAAGRDTHAAMGFDSGWGTMADQLGALAETL